jgi:hypothetical protein
MGVAVVTPISTVSQGFTNVGGASTLAAALADTSDQTYGTDTVAGGSGGHFIEAKMAAVALPAGAVIKRVTPRIKHSQPSGSEGLLARAFRKITGTSKYAYLTPEYAFTPAFAARTAVLPSGGPMLTAPAGYPTYTPATVAAELWVRVSANSSVLAGGTDDHRIHRIELEVEWDEQPTVSGLGFDPPDAPVRTSSPTLVWTNSDPEGVPQQGYRAVAWPASAAADPKCPGANATSFVDSTGVTRTAAAWSGTKADPSVLGTADQHTFSQLADGSYVAFVVTADLVGSQIRWSTAQGQLAFTMYAAPPPAPQITSGPTWDAASQRAALTGYWPVNLLAADDSNFEGSAGNWAGSNATVVRQTTQFKSGQAGGLVTIGSAGNGTALLNANGQRKVIPGLQYTARVLSRAVSVGRSARAVAWWVGPAGNIMSVSTGPTQADGTGGWTELAFTGVAPAGAAKVAIGVEYVSAGAGEQHYIDEPSLARGPNGFGWSRGGWDLAAARLLVELANRGPLPGYADGVPLTEEQLHSFTIYDQSGRHNVASSYRASMVASDGSYEVTTGYSATVGPVTPQIDGFYLRDPSDWATPPVPLSIAGPLPMPSEEALGVFNTIGGEFPVFVSSAIRGGPMEVAITVVGEAAKQALDALRGRRKIMVLQSDMDGLAWWVRFGPQYVPTLPVSTARKAAAARPYQVQATLMQSYGPDGQTRVP